MHFGSCAFIIIITITLPILLFYSKLTFFFVPAGLGSMFCNFYTLSFRVFRLFRAQPWYTERGLIGLFRYRHPMKLQSNRIFITLRI
jgi:hypothetical protein